MKTVVEASIVKCGEKLVRIRKVSRFGKVHVLEICLSSLRKWLEDDEKEEDLKLDFISSLRACRGTDCPHACP